MTTTPRLPAIPELTRRNMMFAAGAAAAAAILAVGPVPPVSATGSAPDSDPFTEPRRRWVEYLTGGTDIDLTHPDISALVSKLSDDAAAVVAAAGALSAASDIWPDFPMAGPNPANIHGSYRNVFLVATAWSTPGTAQHGDPAVAASLVSWYRHLAEHWYNLTVRKTGNWWFWEVGVPRALGDITALIDAELDAADRDASMAAVRRFTPNPNFRGTGTSFAEAGGNRADKALNCLLRGIATRDEADMTLARDALSDVVGGGRRSLFGLVTSGNGFYADGSYIDHRYLPYVGTYGNVAIGGVARSLMLLGGTPWEVTDPNVSVILDAPQRSFAPFIWNGRMVETVRGRAVSRERGRDHNDAFGTINSLMLLAAGLGEPYRSTYRSMAKAWLERCTVSRTATAGISSASRALALMADSSVQATPEPVGHVGFGVQERMVHRGKGWAYTVATSSSRIGRYEWGNNENNLGWHQGDGAAYLYLEGDQGQYSDDYWPTVDPYRLVGTTASLTPRSSGSGGAGTGIPRASNAWGGGVTLGGQWGTSGMDLTSSHGEVSAKKSWFLLDDMVIALGSGVQASADAETTAENRSFPVESEVALTLDGQGVGEPIEVDDPAWAHLDSVAGYVFLGSQRVRAGVAERSGSWYDINSGSGTGGSTDTRTRRYATLSALHPAGTSGGRYGYVILPGASARDTERAMRRFRLRLEVLRHDETAHVVAYRDRGRRMIFAHLFAATDDGVVQADGPCAVLVDYFATRARVALSSPSKSLERASIRIDFGRRMRSVVSAHERLAVTVGSNVAEIEATFAGASGASFEAELSRT